MISFPYTSVKTMSGSTPQFDRAIDSKIKRLYNQLRYTQGVAVDIGGGFQVLSDTGMNVKVYCNGAWGHVYGDFCYEDQQYRTLTVQAADSSYDRIDRVVLRNDISQNVRAIDLYIVKGTPASSPQAPALQSTPEIHEISLATIFIPRNTNTISQERITDTRLDPYVCGVLTNAFGEIDASQFFEQLESLKDTLEQEISDIQAGASSMQKALYDPQNKAQDIFAYPAHLYKATFKVNGWSGSSGNYYQTAYITAVDGGPTITSDSHMTSGLFCDDSVQGEAQAALLEAANIVDKGTKTFGYGTITCTLKGDKPTADAEVYFNAKKGGA